ncbi:hypothetical protein Tco_1123179 [Tanacetum coccineum]|uniref:Uncharacterized protein n=1 Tax=Tanacetum coccineum TaxID=301880 RepID=A0ABQ5J6C9_9ASTR
MYLKRNHSPAIDRGLEDEKTVQRVSKDLGSGSKYLEVEVSKSYCSICKTEKASNVGVAEEKAVDVFSVEERDVNARKTKELG